MSAHVHVLYLETAEDQRNETGGRSAGCHLNVSGLGPTLCTTCSGVADVWRGRLDNMQCALRMCCAEGALFRPFVAQFALLSPRAAVNYELARFGNWLAKEGTKRATEAVVVGAALRAASSDLSPNDSGVAHTAFECADDGTGEGMWQWAAAWAAAVRAGSGGGRVVSLLLDAAAPPLASCTAAGVLAAHVGSAAVSDVVILVGGPSGVPRAWRERLEKVVGRPLLKVSLGGGVQHSAPALAELLMMHERGDLLPLLHDRLALTANQHKAWRRAEREAVHTWLRHLGLHADGGGGTPRPAAEAMAGLLEAHLALMRRISAIAPAAGGFDAARGQEGAAVQPTPGPDSGKSKKKKQKKRRRE